MKAFLKNIHIGKFSLLVLAVLFFISSIVFKDFYSNRLSVAKEVQLAEKYINAQQKDFFSFLEDTSLLHKLVSNSESLPAFSHIASKTYSILLYATSANGNLDMKFWNDQLVTPSNDMLNAPDGEYFSHLSNGWYYTIKITKGNMYSFAIIPVRSEFFIETDYLPKEFVYSRSADQKVILSDTITKYPVKTLAGKILFYLDKKTSVAVPFNDLQTVLLRLAGVLFLLIFIHQLTEKLTRKIGEWKAIGFLAFILLFFRILTYLDPSLLNLRQFELFSPLIYGSNYIQRSLGDLLVNALLFCWVILYAWSKLHLKDELITGYSTLVKWILGLISIILLVFSTFLLATVIKSLVADSKISFDVTDFFGLNQYTVIGFVVLACLSLSYYYFSQLLFRFIFNLFGNSKSLIYFVIGIAGLIYLTFISGNPDVLFYLPVLVWLLIYTWLVNRQEVLLKNVRVNVAGFLSWIFIFSASISFIMLTENNKAEWEKRKRIADKLALQTDPSSERLMSIAIQYLDNDFLSDNFYRFYNQAKGKIVRDSIIRENYSGYLNKYDTRLYIYDANNKGIFNEDSTSYETLNTILTVQSKPTKIAGLFFYETSFDKFNYITRRDVTDSGSHKIGSFFIISNPKSFSQEALFPELFRQFRDADPENSPIYSNAVYINGKLVSPPGNYPFAIWLTNNEIPKEEFQERINGKYDELWYRANNEKIVVIARQKENTIEAMTLFSYIFCSFLFLVVLFQVISFLFKTGFNIRGLRKQLQLNIRSQVHTTIIFISIFSFLIIGIATISFFITRYNRNNSEKLSRTMKIMVNEMQKKLSEHNTFDDVIKLYDSVSNYDLQKLVNEVSDIHGVDVNVYDLQGDLQVSSEANVYTKGVLSKKMDPAAFFHLNRLRQVQHSQEEKIGNFTYLSIYSPVRDEEGKVYAYINIPYFTSKPELRQEISNFLVTLINLNAFIFLIAGLIALFITNRITGSFSIISNKMKEVNLGKMNEQIIWNRNDEIGDLVNEYNKMVNKLGESATALAKSEREGAWREMARQVAHEIKNPLTPMKLSIQYLQKAINNNQPNVKELSSNVANTLVEQIDHLAKIAADFSQFANIGNTHVELFDIHEVIRSMKDLYESNPNIHFTWMPIHQQLMVEADKTQINRLFTNLLANAIEACNDRTCNIDIREEKNGDMLRISIKDNGEGIPPDKQESIFIPNFTTKSSGTGLGLAMCKGIVEQAKGKIWFETVQGVGTTFHIEIPLVNK